MHVSANPATNADGTDVEPLAYTVPNAAKVLDIGVRTAWALVKAGKIQSYRVGRSVRVSRRALLAFIEERENAA